MLENPPTDLRVTRVAARMPGVFVDIRPDAA